MLRIDLPMDQIAALCEKWKITELAIFGSALRDDFGPDSDVDFLVIFAENSGVSAFDFVEIKDELSAMVGREVDLVCKDAIANPFRRANILDGHQVVSALQP